MYTKDSERKFEYIGETIDFSPPCTVTKVRRKIGKENSVAGILYRKISHARYFQSVTNTL